MKKRFGGQVHPHMAAGAENYALGPLAAANLNIATMRVFRRSVGGDAMVALELDGSADTELIARLSALQGVYHVAYLAAKEE